MSILFTICSLFTALAIASPHQDHGPPNMQAQKYSYTEWNSETGITYTHFSPDWPTCGNDKTLSAFSTSTTVNVRPDCDNVINAICTAAAAQNTLNTANPSYFHYILGTQSISSTNNTCEGHLLFSQTTLGDQFNYEICVAAFQGVSEMCMLMDDPNFRTEYAAPGKQFGVRNIWHSPASGADPAWLADNTWNTLPGYMLGATGVFGSINGTDASDFSANGTITSGGPIMFPGGGGADGSSDS